MATHSIVAHVSAHWTQAGLPLDLDRLSNKAWALCMIREAPHIVDGSFWLAQVGEDCSLCALLASHLQQHCYQSVPLRFTKRRLNEVLQVGVVAEVET